jgi:hypothetical protein
MSLAVTLEMTEPEARAFCEEVHELEALLQETPDKGNTRTGLAEVRRIRDYLVSCGLGVRTQQWPVPPPHPVAQARIPS